jgi:hypothetical protein
MLYSYLKASIEESLDALIAGAILKITPTATEKVILRDRLRRNA